jgi:hypothetical protein
VKLAIEMVDADKIEGLAQKIVDASRERIEARHRRPQHRDAASRSRKDEA